MQNPNAGAKTGNEASGRRAGRGDVARSHRSFALLWGGQTLSCPGDRTQAVALNWWILEETGPSARRLARPIDAAICSDSRAGIADEWRIAGSR
jgi:hypothetical protein